MALRRLVPCWHRYAQVQFLCTSVPLPVPTPDLPYRADTVDERAVQAEQLASSTDSDNHPEAYRLASLAADSGCPRGIAIQGALLERGIGCEPDAKRSLQLLESSALTGEPWGMLLYAHGLLKSCEPSEDTLDNARFVVDEKGGAVVTDKTEVETPGAVARRERKARRAAGFRDDQGPEFEEYRVAKLKKQREETEAVAERWIAAAAERGLDAAIVSLGNRAFERGELNQAKEYYERAIAATRNTDAYYNLGRILSEGGEGVERDAAKAMKMMQMAAQLGDATAQTHLAQTYRNGTWEFESDTAAARSFAEQAAAQRDPEALYLLAAMHRAGEGGYEADENRYVRFLSESAKLNYPDAIAELADLYYKGEAGVECDYKRALQEFLRAGKLGHADAICSAAVMTYHGRGRESDKHEAFLLYQEAAAMGHQSAMRNLGTMYFNGDGVPKNTTMAEQFFKMADDVDKQNKLQEKEIANMAIKTMPAKEHPMGRMPPNTENESS